MKQEIRLDCPKCKTSLLFKITENLDQMHFFCPNCNEKLQIKQSNYLEIVDMFIAFYKKRKNFEIVETDIIQAKEWISSITNYNGKIDDDERLVQLFAYANGYKRLRKTLLRIKTEFQNNLLPKWKSYYNFIFFTISDEISLITNISNQLFEKIEQTHQVKLTDRNKKEEFIIFLQETNSLFHIIFTSLVKTLGQNSEKKYLDMKLHTFLYIFSVFEKLNEIFKILLYDFPMNQRNPTLKLFDVDNNGALEEYKRIRHCIAHFNILIEDKNLMKFKFIDHYLSKDKDAKTGSRIWKFKTIEDSYEIFAEMIILVLIIYVLLAKFQIYWQSNPENRK